MESQTGLQSKHPADPVQIDFAIITALDKECRAVVKRLKNHTPRRFEDQDIRTYHLGSVPVAGTDEAYRVVAILLPNVGEVAAANAVTDTLVRWKPRFLLMVGIAGGLPQDALDLGDVVVADQVVGYEYGKETEQGFKPCDRVYPAGALLLDRIRNYWDDSWVAGISVPRPEGALPRSPKSFVGPIASGNKVIASTEFRNRLLARWPKLHAVEMEAEGVFAAAFDRPQITQTLVIRGISDMADERKGDVWQEYAAEAAAAYAIGFLSSGSVSLKPGPINPQAIQTPPAPGGGPGTTINIGSISGISGGMINISNGDIIQTFSPAAPSAGYPATPSGTGGTLSANQYARVRQALLDRGPFESDRQLRAVFSHPNLRPWQSGLPQVGTTLDRVEQVMAYLAAENHSDGRNALAILLHVLADRLNPAMECYHRLRNLAQEIEKNA